MDVFLSDVQFFVGYQFTILSSSLASRKTMGGSIQKLTHWGLAAYFYPQAAVKMSPDGEQPLPIEAPPKPSTSRSLGSTLVSLALWIIPAILILAYASYLHSEMGQIRRENTVLKEASLVTPDPVTTTVFSTFTATTTSVSTATATLTVGNKWFFAGDDSTAALESSEPTHLPWESVDDPLPAYTSTPSATPSPTSAYSKHGIFEGSKDPSPWSSIQLPSSREMTEHLRWAIVKLWKVVLKVYHYPLDPP